MTYRRSPDKATAARASAGRVKVLPAASIPWNRESAKVSIWPFSALRASTYQLPS